MENKAPWDTFRRSECSKGFDRTEKVGRSNTVDIPGREANVYFNGFGKFSETIISPFGITNLYRGELLSYRWFTAEFFSFIGLAVTLIGDFLP